MTSKRTRSFLPVLAAVAAVLVLLTAPSAQAMKLKSQNLTELISDSESIVFGTVTSVTDGIDDQGVPYTAVTIAVGSSAKGNIGNGVDYTFRQFGLLHPRTADNGHQFVAVTPDGFATWREGETVVAFLYHPASLTGLQTTAGMAQGKLTLANGTLANEFDNVGLFEGVEIDADLLTPEEQNMLTTPGAVDAQTFMGLVARAVSEGWIENGRMR